MTSVRLLSKSAFPLFYASNRVVIVSTTVAQALSTYQPLEDLEYLVLSADGTLLAPGETEDPSTHLAPVGAPIGVRALVVDEMAADGANDWRDWIATQTGREPPKVFVLADGSSLTDIYAAIAECMLADSKHTRAQSARTERDLVALRWDYEQSLINLEKARRIIRGAGFDTRYATMSVPVGQGEIGPDQTATNPLAPYSVRYAMPCDAAGVVGISLHFRAGNSPDAEGDIALTLKRSVDGQVLGRASQKYAEISDGWAFFDLEKPLAGSFGDCELTIEWSQQTPGPAPMVSLSDMVQDPRGGEEQSGLLPAMQIWSGFTLGQLSHDTPLLPHGCDQKQAAFADLMACGGSFGPAALDQEEYYLPSPSWVQTHLQAEGAVGLAIPQILPPTVSSVEVTVETAHDAGPPALYLVASYDGEAELAQETITNLLSSIKVGDAERSGYDAKLNISWSVELVTPGKRTRIVLPTQSAKNTGHPYGLACAVISATEDVAYGWCRWHEVRVAYEAETVLPTAVRTQPAMLRRMRSVKFPEIGDQLEYLAGQAKLHQQTVDLGFSPMIVAEDNGSLQTHPLLEDVSAALYRGGAMVGTTRVACDVETAHERSPDFRYILLLLPSSVQDKYSAVQGLIKRQLSGDVPILSGQDDKTGAHFFARKLSALDVKSVVIELEKPLSELHDIVVATVPMQGIVSYGWCRWLSLSISSTIDPQPEFSLSAEAD